MKKITGRLHDGEKKVNLVSMNIDYVHNFFSTLVQIFGKLIADFILVILSYLDIIL